MPITTAKTSGPGPGLGKGLPFARVATGAAWATAGGRGGATARAGRAATLDRVVGARWTRTGVGSLSGATTGALVSEAPWPVASEVDVVGSAAALDWSAVLRTRSARWWGAVQ